MAQRPTPTASHMVAALLVLLLPIWLITWLFTRTPAEAPVVAVDYRPAVAEARRAASWPVWAPARLPDGWTPVRAGWTPRGEPGTGGEPQAGDTLELGFLTPERVYIGLDQSDAPAAPFVKRLTHDGSRAGTERVGNLDWERWTEPQGRTHYLVRTADGATAVVSGDLDFPALEGFAGTLASS